MASLPIYFENKDLAAFGLLVVATILVSVGLWISQRLRELALFTMVVAIGFAKDLIDVSIFDAYWYRGTTLGFEISFVDVLAISLLFCTVLNPKHGGVRWFWPAGFTPLLLFIFATAVSITYLEPRIFSLYELSKMLRGLIIFLAVACFIRGKREAMIVVFALSCVVGVEALAAIRQRFIFGIERPQGTLDHANSLSMYFSMVTPILVAAAASTRSVWLRTFYWLAAGATAVGVILAISRAGIPIYFMVVGATLIFCLSWRPTIGKFLGISFAAISVGIMIWFSSDAIIDRYSQATLQEEYLDETKEGRGYYFRQLAVILEDKPHGIGLNNWSYWVSKRYGNELGMQYQNYDHISDTPDSKLIDNARYAAPAHNLGVITLGEIGWIGFILFNILWIRWFHMGFGFLWIRNATVMNKLGIGVFFGSIGIFLHSFTEWTFRQTEIFITFHILIGLLAALHHLRKTDRLERIPNE